MFLSEFWPECLGRLNAALPKRQYDTWVAPLSVGEEADTWVVYAPNDFAFRFVKERLFERLLTLQKELAPKSPVLRLKVGQGQKFAPNAFRQPERPTDALAPEPDQPASVAVSDNARPSASKTRSILAKRAVKETAPKEEAQSDAAGGAPVPAAAPAAETETDASRVHEHTHLDPEHTFETLVPGKGNQIALATAQQIADGPANKLYNPFFVYGGSGMGKTHLVQAIGNRIFQLNPRAKVRYIHAPDYVEEFMSHARVQSYEKFRRKYFNLDLLIMDDVQFLSNKTRTMEEFFLLFNHFFNAKKQVVLTCDRLPARIEQMDDRLITRFNWGLTVEMEPPELEMRVAILQKKAALSGIQMDEKAAFFIADRIRSNVRELEGAFKRVAARSLFESKPIDVPLVHEALADILAASHKPVTLEEIQNTVGKFYNISMRDLLGQKRQQNIVRPRQMAMLLAKDLTSLSLAAIGDGFGGRDHTTVISACKKMNELKAEHEDMTRDYDTLSVMLKGA